MLLLIVATLFIIANNPPMEKDYDKLWNQVDSLDKLQQPNKAMDIVEQIYHLAQKDENSSQRIKTQLYRLKLSSQFEEDYLVKAIGKMQAEVAEAKSPEKQILHSILGELTMKYYQANRYKILDRSATSGFDDEDIQTWDAAKLLKEAKAYYKLSLENPKELQSISINSFSAIIEKEKSSGEYRPTLFDFLAWRTLGFLMIDETDVKVAAKQFIPNDPKYFEQADSFIQLDFSAQSQYSNTALAFEIYQSLLQFHLNSKNPKALIDVELKRLEFLYHKAVVADKDKLYEGTLNELRDNYKFSEESTSVSFKLAQFYQQQGAKYNPLISDDYRWMMQKAKSICEEATKAFPQSEGAKNCEALVQKIIASEMSLSIQKAVIPNQPTPGLLTWKNYSKLYFRLVKMDVDDYDKISRRNNTESIARVLAMAKFTEAWTLELPNEQDFQSHSTEFKIPATDPGFYVLLISDAVDFESGKNKLTWATYWGTNLSYINQRNNDGAYDIFVLERKSGKPKADVNVNIYKRNYDYRQRSYETQFVSGLTTNSEGFVKINTDNDVRGGVFIQLVHNRDKYVPDENFYLSPARERVEKTQQKTFFFTDRAIYRPGQQVYFKAVLLDKTGEKYEISPATNTKIEFYDANSRLVSTQELLTNEYGSVNGFFTIPTGLLNGEMRIKNQSGSISIRVEEYKRPKFEVVFEPVSGSYKLDEEITLTGNAKAYAGNNLDGASVKYRVVRSSFFPRPYFYYRGFWPRAQAIEIAIGTSFTDDSGNFEISFRAIPDYSIDSKFKPSFSYTITADVTDINGETQSASQTVNVGSEALVLDVSIPENVNIQKLRDYEIVATNLNGEKQQTEVAIKIFKLIEPERLIKGRSWRMPDEYILTEAEFLENFPNRVYKNEDDATNWEKGAVVFDVNVNTGIDSLLKAEIFEQWEQGKYLIQMTALDVYSTEVKTEKLFTLFDPAAKQPPLKTYSWFEALKSTGEPGQSAVFLLGTSAKNVNILYEIQHRGETVERKWLSLSNKQQQIEVPILEAYRGNFTFQYSFVVDNQFYSGTETIEVPYTNKQLDLAFETMRSDLEPGSKEKWMVTIKNKNGDKVAAEMLASMYDASLDAFVTHKWNFDLFHSNNQLNRWQAGSNFLVTSGSSFDFIPHIFMPYIYHQYDRLNWFGFNQYNSFYGMEAMGGMKSRANTMSAMDGTSQQGEPPSRPTAVEDAEIHEGDEIVGAAEETSVQTQFAGMPLRRNFNETAFFYPDLKTNQNGEVVIQFTLPESFTKWKFMGLGYTKDLMTGWLEQEFTAAKKLMIVPNAPRFFREGDTLNFSAKITNLSNASLNGFASLEFYDAVSMKLVSNEVLKVEQQIEFAVEKEKSTSVKWKIVVPENYGVLTYRVKAVSKDFTDGEEKSVPVLPNRMMVTEAMPMPIGGMETRDFEFEKLIQSGDSKTLENYRLTLEFASNPAWYAVQALPVISESKYNNAISIFNAFFANSLAFHITNKNPEIQRVFENWKTESPESFLSKLETNPKLKQVILEQTPWVLEASDQKERKQRMALLFDLNNMQNRLDNSIRLLQQYQKPGGGFVWMDGLRESRYITQAVVLGLGKLDHLGIIDAIGDERINRMMKSAVMFLDRAIKEDYDRLQKRFPDKMEENHLSTSHVQYLYARSFFKYLMINPSNEVAYNYFRFQAEKYWTEQNNYMQGMIALALHRDKKPEIPQLILTSLKDRSLFDEEMGMYWRNTPGYFWYQSPIETQALMIELFDEVGNDRESVENMKIWLLRQKQTQDWKTSRATAEAVYALMSRGSNLLASTELVNISLGGEKLTQKKMGKVEAGTGYFQTSWEANDFDGEMGKVTVQKTDEGIAWGAMYWQYFEDLDKITQHETGLSVQKELFVEQDSETGRVITPIQDGTLLSVGDKVKVRIEIRVDRNMEFVHLRDMRAAAFEPVNVLSGYQYSGGLGYYQTTKDASTDFFFDYLNKGIYVFEYTLIASQEGDFSNGITTLQCMYAPEFVSHSKGVRVKVVKK